MIHKKYILIITLVVSAHFDLLSAAAESCSAHSQIPSDGQSQKKFYDPKKKEWRHKSEGDGEYTVYESVLVTHPGLSLKEKVTLETPPREFGASIMQADTIIFMKFHENNPDQELQENLLAETRFALRNHSIFQQYHTGRDRQIITAAITGKRLNNILSRQLPKALLDHIQKFHPFLPTIDSMYSLEKALFHEGVIVDFSVSPILQAKRTSPKALIKRPLIEYITNQETITVFDNENLFPTDVPLDVCRSRRTKVQIRKNVAPLIFYRYLSGRPIDNDTLQEFWEKQNDSEEDSSSPDSSSEDSSEEDSSLSD